MKPLMNADLHCHSTVSDGQLAPADVAARAHAGGVTLWALTDHDQLGGQREAREAAEALGMRYLSGVEISVTWAGRTVHIVGLNVDRGKPGAARRPGRDPQRARARAASYRRGAERRSASRTPTKARCAT